MTSIPDDLYDKLESLQKDSVSLLPIVMEFYHAATDANIPLTFMTARLTVAYTMFAMEIPEDRVDTALRSIKKWYLQFKDEIPKLSDEPP